LKGSGLGRLYEDRWRVSEDETGEDGNRKRNKLSPVASLSPPLRLRMSYAKSSNVVKIILYGGF